jgi:hypothetical protein
VRLNQSRETKANTAALKMLLHPKSKDVGGKIDGNAFARAFGGYAAIILGIQ